MVRVGFSCGFVPNEKDFEALAEAGIRDIELSFSHENCIGADYKVLEQFSKTYGVNLWSYHLPFGSINDLDIASLNEELRCSSVARWRELIKRAADIGVDKFIAHPSSEPKSEDPKTREKEIKASMESLNELAGLAAQSGAIIAVEDLPRSCLGNTADEMLKLVSANDKLRVCFDTNHLLTESNLNFVEKLADKIVTLHVSDYDFVNERHWLPGEGNIDWQSLYKKICESGYKGVWMYEIGLKCPKTILRDRDLRFSDFYRNATEIFENKPLTVFSKPKENLGMWE